MGWTLPVDCECGAELKSLDHLLKDCPRLSPGRPQFFSYLVSKITNFNLKNFNLDNLIFDPDISTVIEIGKFFIKGNTII